MGKHIPPTTLNLSLFEITVVYDYGPQSLPALILKHRASRAKVVIGIESSRAVRIRKLNKLAEAEFLTRPAEGRETDEIKRGS